MEMGDEAKPVLPKTFDRRNGGNICFLRPKLVCPVSKPDGLQEAYIPVFKPVYGEKLAHNHQPLLKHASGLLRQAKRQHHPRGRSL